MYKIGIVIGSLRKDSFNLRLGLALQRMLPADFVGHKIEIGGLPLYNQDDDEHQAVVVQEFKASIKEMQGIIFVTPEYNRSLPGVLKNAIDHASRPYGQSVWAGKPAGVVGVSVGAIGTALAQQHLRNILAYLDMPTLGQTEMFIQMKEGLFDEQGNIGKASEEFVIGWVSRYADWVRKHV